MVSTKTPKSPQLVQKHQKVDGKYKNPTKSPWLVQKHQEVHG